jgi:hypothetical protein
MTKAVTRRVMALENAIGTGRVTVYLPESVEDDAKAVEEALRGSGYDPATTQVASIWWDEMFDEPFAEPFMTHEERLKLLR